MPLCRKLLLFSAWQGEDARDRHNWREYYSDLLSTTFADYAKIVVVNPGCSERFVDMLSNVPNLVTIAHVPPELDMRSDASGYQRALSLARPMLDDFDVVTLCHSKGTTHRFWEMRELVDAYRDQFLAPGILDSLHSKNPNAIYIYRAALAEHWRPIRDLRFLTDLAGVPPTVAFSAFSTIYAVSAQVLKEACSKLPEEFFNGSLSDLGFNRWFFETVFPGFVTAFGAGVVFRTPPRLNATLEPNASYIDEPLHSQVLIVNEFERLHREGPAYHQEAVPLYSSDGGASHNVRHHTPHPENEDSGAVQAAYLVRLRGKADSVRTSPDNADGNPPFDLPQSHDIASLAEAAEDKALMKIVELTSLEGKKMSVNLAHVVMMERYDAPTRHTLVHTILKARDGTPLVLAVREEPKEIVAL